MRTRLSKPLHFRNGVTIFKITFEWPIHTYYNDFMIYIAIALNLQTATAAEVLKNTTSVDDYPLLSVLRDEEGSAYSRVTISPTGEMERCDIIKSSNIRRIDEAVCKIQKDFRFKSAKDHHGNPVYGIIEKWFSFRTYSKLNLKSYSVDTVLQINRLPDKSPENPIARLILTVDESGKLENCDIETSSGSTFLDKIACDAGVNASSIKPAQDAMGTAVRSVQRLAIGFTAKSNEIGHH